MSKPYTVDAMIRDLTRFLLAAVVVIGVGFGIWLARSLW